VLLPLTGPTGDESEAERARRAPGQVVRDEVGEGEANMPRALGPHLERLRRALPGNGGESREGPGVAAEERLIAMARARSRSPATAGRSSRTACSGAERGSSCGDRRRLGVA
jgi:hypothetical protein